MSTATAPESHAAHSATTKPPVAATLRVWPAVVLVVALWIILYANHTMELSAGTRFISRMAAYAIAFLAFFGWWLTRSAVSRRDRWLAVGVTIVFGVLARLVADKTIDGFALALSSLPFVLTVWTAWLVVCRPFKRRTQRVGFCVLILLTFGYFTLLRWDGLDAKQRAEMSWRWTPTNEQLFLASHVHEAEAAKATTGPAQKWTLQPGDWPELRGPNRDGVLPGIEIAPDWKEHPPKQLWRKRVGPAWSGMIVVDGHLVTQEQRGDTEAVVCYDAATGDELWAHTDHIRFEESLAGAGPRATPTFAAGRIYALGGTGVLNCLAAETGDVIWSHDIVKDAGVAAADRPQWGYSVSPLVVDGLVIVFAGGTDKSVLAYHADDGKLAWTAPGGKQSYSSPQLATLSAQQQVVMHDTTAIRSLNIADGKEQWSYPNGSEISLAMVQPHVMGPSDLVVAITPGMARLEVTRQLPTDGTQSPRWQTNKLRPDFSDFVIYKGSVFGLNDGVLCCLDAETGKLIWKKLRLGHGQVLLLPEQDALLVSNDKGEIILVAIDRKGPKELCRFQAIEGKTWNGPVLVGNRVFLRNAEEMAAYEINVRKSASQAPAPAAAK